MRPGVNALWVALLAFAAVAAAGLQGCSKASQPYQSGRLYFSQKLYEKAAVQFEMAVKEDPENPKTHFELAKTYAELDRNEEAGKEFKIALEKGPKLAEEINTAVQHYRAEHYNSALDLIRQGKYGDAIAELQEAIYLDDSDPNQYINMGYCYSELGEMDLAVSYYEKALELSPEDEKARANLVGTFAKEAAELRKKKEYDQSIKFYERVLELYVNDPDFDLTTRSPADLVAELKGDEQGLGYVFDMGLVYLDIADNKKDKGAGETAAAIFKALYDADPADDDALYNYAYTKMILEDYQPAIEAYGELLDRRPKEASYYMAMATAYVKGGGGDADLRMKGILYFALARALESDKNKLAPATFKSRDKLEDRLKKQYRVWKDMKKVLDSWGVPEDIYSYKGDTGDVEAWFYWTRGEAAVFTNGIETGKISFAPQEE